MNNGLFAPQQFPPVGMPQNAPPDMSTMYPQGAPQMQTPSMPQGTGVPPQMPESTQAALKYSIGDPLVDKYINMFLGSV